MDFEKTTIQLRLVKSICLKTNRIAKRDRKSIRNVRSEREDKVHTYVAKLYDALNTDNREAAIKAYLTKSKDNHIPGIIWNKWVLIPEMRS